MEFGRDFRVLHYAGEVTYCVVGFIDKNKDTLFQDFKRLLYNRSVHPVCGVISANYSIAVSDTANRIIACQSLKFLVASICDLPDVINC